MLPSDSESYAICETIESLCERSEQNFFLNDNKAFTT